MKKLSKALISEGEVTLDNLKCSREVLASALTVYNAEVKAAYAKLKPIIDDYNHYTDDMSNWLDYESGPFCRHWGDPSDCTEVCVCSHTCTQHDYAVPGECMVDGCECKEWREQ